MKDQRSRHSRPRRPTLTVIARGSLALAVAVMAALPLLARPASAAELPNATISNIMNNPSAYLGRTVMVAGDVEQVLGPRSFTIDDNNLLTVGKMLVVSSRPLLGRQGQAYSIDPLVERTVWIRGEVRSFDVEAFEDEAGVGLPDEGLDEWEGQPALIASSITLAPIMLDPAVTEWTTVDEVTDDPDAYYGRTVTVSGSVEDVFGSRSFALEDNDLLFDEQLLIVSARPLLNRDGEAIHLSRLNDRTLMVTGTVHQFNVAAFEDQLGVDLDESRLADWGGRPALIATSIMAWSSVRTPPAAPAPAVIGRPGVTVDDIAENPGAHYGQTVRVSGEVGEILGSRAFTFEDNDLLFDEQILVVTRQPMLDQSGRPSDAGIAESEVLWITGTVHQFNLAAFEDRLGLDLNDARFAGWGGRPAIIADSIVHWPPLTAPPAVNGRTSVTVDEITDDPSAYYGQAVTVTGLVEDTLGSRSLVMEDNDLLFNEQVLVVSAQPMLDRVGRLLDSSMLTGRALSVHGAVRPFVLAEVEREIGVDLDDSVFEGWEGRPAIVADAAHLLPS